MDSNKNDMLQLNSSPFYQKPSQRLEVKLRELWLQTKYLIDIWSRTKKAKNSQKRKSNTASPEFFQYYKEEHLFLKLLAEQMESGKKI